MNVKRKLKSNLGFSLAETLLAVMILLLVSILLATGVPTVKAVYERVTIGANAQVMLSTTISSLRNELGTAKNITVSSDGKSISYYSADTGAYSKLSLDETSASPSISLQEYNYKDPALFFLPETDDEVLPPLRRLISSISATEKLYVTYDTVELSTDKNTVIIKGLEVKQEGRDAVLAKIGTEENGSDNELYIPLTFGPGTTAS